MKQRKELWDDFYDFDDFDDFAPRDTNWARSLLPRVSQSHEEE